MNILRFEANTPVQVALKYDGGRDVAGRYGPQVLYTLADGRLMYLEPKAARRIDELEITAGNRFPFASARSRVARNARSSGKWIGCSQCPRPLGSRSFHARALMNRVSPSVRRGLPKSSRDAQHSRPTAAPP